MVSLKQASLTELGLIIAIRKVWHEPVHTRNKLQESATLQECFRFLNLTSRSFSAVIQELHPELLVPVTLFYLVLRGLDTIEDDMTLSLARKEPLLRGFDDTLEQDGWTFLESGPDEKDRELLVHFDVVISELRKIKPTYYSIIKDITRKMGNGMADYARKCEDKNFGVQTSHEYEEYCHHVAGLVGEGLTQLFVEAELANPTLLDRPELTESMGQFLQKTNIIRDIREDWDDERRWWPRDIWSQYVDRWEDLFNPAKREVALHCSSAMVLNALKHVEDCLFYMAGIREQSVFNFVAIPQSMAIATLELVFRNPDIFVRNVKISKGDACRLMTMSTQNLQAVCHVFREYIRRIHHKNDPRDPNFMAISIQCGKIEQFIETLFPSQKAEVAQRRYEEAKLNGPADKTPLVLMSTAVMAILAVIMVAIAYFAGLLFNDGSALVSSFKAADAGTTTTTVTTTATILTTATRRRVPEEL